MSAIVGIVVVAGQVLMTQMKASSDLDLARRQRDNSLAHLAVSGAVSKSTFRVLIQTAGLSEKAQVTDAQSGQPVGTTNLANAADLALRTQEFHVTNTHGVKATNVVVNIGSGVPLESVIPQYPNDKAASSVSPDRMSAVVSLNQLSVEQELVIDIVVAEPFKTSDYESWSAALHITPTCDECDKSSNSGPVV